jgi:hypothetical protein
MFMLQHQLKPVAASFEPCCCTTHGEKLEAQRNAKRKKFKQLRTVLELLINQECLALQYHM